MASSETVTSIGVLNVAIVDMNDSTVPRCSMTSGSAKGQATGSGPSSSPASGTGCAATSSYSSRSASERIRAI